MLPVRTRLHASAVLAGTLLVLAACKDVPTVPEAVHLLAGGEEWVAVSVPADLPRLETWLPFVAGEGGGARPHDPPPELDRSGREARRLALPSLEGAPPPDLLQRSLRAIDSWCERVAALTAPGHRPGLAATLEYARTERLAAATLLEAGDTASAVLRLAGVSDRIREHSPEAVVLRVLARAESQLMPGGTDPAARDRAAHLLATARYEAVHGDPRRALRRALYALQILEGREVRTVTSGADSTCLGPFC